MKEKVMQYLLDLKCVLLDEEDEIGAEEIEEVISIVKEHDEP